MTSWVLFLVWMLVGLVTTKYTLSHNRKVREVYDTDQPRYREYYLTFLVFFWPFICLLLVLLPNE